MKVFYRKYKFLLSEKDIQKDLSSILFNWEKGKEHGEIRILKKKSENSMIFRYINSLKEGQFNIGVKKQENIIIIEIEETLLGFFVPLLCFSISFFAMLNYNSKLPIMLFFLSFLFLGLNYLSFQSKVKDILEKIEKLLPLQER